jgi:hypothetical protein
MNESPATVETPPPQPKPHKSGTEESANDITVLAESRAQREKRIRGYFSANPLLKWLASRRRPTMAFCALLAGWYALVFVVCAFERTMPTNRGLLHDRVMLSLAPVLLVLFYATRRLVLRVDELLAQFHTMIKPEHLDTPVKRQELQRAVAAARDAISLRALASPKWYWALQATWFAISLIFQVRFTLNNLQTADSWSFSMFAHPWGYAVCLLWNLFYLIVVFGNASWYVLAVALTVFPLVKRYADNDALWVVPNAPDGQGGLAPVGSVAFAMTLTLWPCLILLAVDLQHFRYDPWLMIGTAGTMALSCFIFFWPLYSTHEAMSRAKRAELSRVALLFRHEYAGLPTGIETNKTAHEQADVRLMSMLQRMSKLTELHAAVKAMPVWPIDISTVTKFVLLVCTPAISALLQSTWPSQLSEGITDLLKNFAK